MQDVTSYVSNASPLSVAVNGGESKKTTSEKTSTKSFISIMLSQLSEGASNAKVSTKTTKETVDTKEITKALKAEEQEAKSVDEHLLEDLLKIVNALRTNTQSTIFPTLKSTSRLDKVLGNETALKELSEAKSIGDLMALSKKYDLGLEKLSFSKESVEKLQKEFPTLAKSNFFESLQEEVETQKSASESKPLTPSISPLEKQVQKNENTAPVSALKELMSKDNTDEPKVVTSTQKVETKETLKTVLEQAPLVEDEIQAPKEIKIVETITTESKKTATNPIEVVAQKVVTQTTEEIKAEKKVKVEPVLAAPTEEDVEVKAPIQTRVSETKVENSLTQKGLTEAILQAIKTEKPVIEKKPEENQVVAQVAAPLHEEPIQVESPEIKQNTMEVKTVQKQEITTKQPSAPKESLNQFASDLREKIENYKPPIMKVELTLNPRNLGEVDVTLLTRGNNLHVNISSNSNTMTLFTQNQAEFKNALVNMGFTNLEMNFSDQQKNQQQQQNNRQNNNQVFDELTGETSNETMASIEVIIPQYV